jgi:hypothetical protein
MRSRRLRLETLESRLQACGAPFDYNGDGRVDTRDVVAVINRINDSDNTSLMPIDALRIINDINAHGSRSILPEAQIIFTTPVTVYAPGHLSVVGFLAPNISGECGLPVTFESVPQVTNIRTESIVNYLQTGSGGTIGVIGFVDASLTAGEYPISVSYVDRFGPHTSYGTFLIM